MKKIYYLQKIEVELGDLIAYKGFKTTVTEELIELNPELFIVEDSIQELLDKAKRDFPVGTVYRSLFDRMCTVGDKSSYSLGAGSSILIDGMYIYREGKWAEVLPLKFITEDGVSIYDGMKTYFVRKNLELEPYRDWDGDNTDNKYFYHKENALAYIEKLKEKTLEDYENMLLRTNIDSVNAREECLFYHTLKVKEPKLYYTKILQLIADDLNNGWIADFTNNDEKWCISEKDIIHYMKLKVHGLVYFRLSELAEKARVILGDKLSVYFNK